MNIGQWKISLSIMELLTAPFVMLFYGLENIVEKW